MNFHELGEFHKLNKALKFVKFDSFVISVYSTYKTFMDLNLNSLLYKNNLTVTRLQRGTRPVKH